MSKRPYALWLADRFDDVGDWYEFDAKTWVPGAAAELRRLHAVNGQLLDALQTVMQLDMRGHALASRLQFTPAGRHVLAVVDTAIAAATPPATTQAEG